MALLTETVQNLTPAEKAELYYLLGTDRELNNYLYSNKHLFDELSRRDEEAATGNMQVLSRAELTQRLKERRNEV